ncbi:hypothetical protein OC25_20915 [Pedobacter kyungheensis]|uniref:Uncharacterized protein n=1 Tax=Pedobacter kyungheensis TaxID=1069985 RepID=A0A0C1D3J2_9SPHI|nr:hypothetical protein OC25_20915 [Pedobacter kyungheensis]
MFLKIINYWRIARKTLLKALYCVYKPDGNGRPSFSRGYSEQQDARPPKVVASIFKLLKRLLCYNL